MNEPQLFNFHGQDVRTVTINNEPYFVGKDVATILGYKKPENAIAMLIVLGNSFQDVNKKADSNEPSAKLIGKGVKK